MKRNLIAIILAISLIMSSVFIFSACSLFAASTENGTYYLYSNGTLNKDIYVKLNDGQWTSNSSQYTSGTYTINDGIIQFLTVENVMGVNIIYTGGRYNRGGLEFNGNTFYKEGFQRSNINEGAVSEDFIDNQYPTTAYLLLNT